MLGFRGESAGSSSDNQVQCLKLSQILTGKGLIVFDFFVFEMVYFKQLLLSNCADYKHICDCRGDWMCDCQIISQISNTNFYHFSCILKPFFLSVLQLAKNLQIWPKNLIWKISRIGDSSVFLPVRYCEERLRYFWAAGSARRQHFVPGLLDIFLQKSLPPSWWYSGESVKVHLLNGPRQQL